MLIGEIVNKTGLSRDTIRFYEKQGLINVDRDAKSTNNYKVYTHEILNRLLLIRRIKSFGFTLNETAELLELVDANKASCRTVSRQIEEKVTLIDKKIIELMEIKKLMLSLTDDCCYISNNDNCPTLTKVERAF